MDLVVYPHIEEKLWVKHRVTVAEVRESFANRVGSLGTEDRPQHRWLANRYWFIALTNCDRRLKVVFAIDESESGPVIITAYEPNQEEERQYESL